MLGVHDQEALVLASSILSSILIQAQHLALLHEVVATHIRKNGRRDDLPLSLSLLIVDLVNK